MALLLGTIGFTVVLHSALDLPPVFGMMTGLGVLKVYGYILGRRLERTNRWHGPAGGIDELDDVATGVAPGPDRFAPSEIDKGFDVFRQLERVEWDTLMFFYGVILTVGALGTLGYLGARLERRLRRPRADLGERAAWAARRRWSTTSRSCSRC